MSSEKAQGTDATALPKALLFLALHKLTSQPLHPIPRHKPMQSVGPDNDVVQKIPGLALLHTIVLPGQMLIKSKAHSNYKAVVGFYAAQGSL